ncbi:MAG: carbohydrate ABC transporter permease [Lachnospirales bacterium]
MFKKISQQYKNGGVTTFLMLLPTIILFFAISVYPFFWIFKYVFYNYDGFNAYFVGFDNFIKLFTRDSVYWLSVIHTFEYTVYKLIFTIPLALLAAIIVNNKMKGHNFFRITFFLPTVVSTAVYSMIFYFIFSAYNGILNAYLMDWGMLNKPIDWLGSAKYAMKSVVVVAIWGGFGNYMILFLAGLQSISADVYESSKMDGANSIQNFKYITIPMLGPILKIILMLAITTALKDYESIMVLTNGGPQNRTKVMFLYIYELMFGTQTGFSAQQIGYGAAASLISAIIIGIITVIYLKTSKKLDDVY